MVVATAVGTSTYAMFSYLERYARAAGLLRRVLPFIAIGAVVVALLLNRYQLVTAGFAVGVALCLCVRTFSERRTEMDSRLRVLLGVWLAGVAYFLVSDIVRG